MSVAVLQEIIDGNADDVGERGFAAQVQVDPLAGLGLLADGEHDTVQEAAAVGCLIVHDHGIDLGGAEQSVVGIVDPELLLIPVFTGE